MVTVTALAPLACTRLTSVASLTVPPFATWLTASAKEVELVTSTVCGAALVEASSAYAVVASSTPTAAPTAGAKATTMAALNALHKTLPAIEEPGFFMYPSSHIKATSKRHIPFMGMDAEIIRLIMQVTHAKEQAGWMLSNMILRPSDTRQGS